MKKQGILTMLFASICLLANAQTEVDITKISGGKLSTQYGDSPEGEGVDKLIDNSSETKFLTFHSSTWIQFASTKSYVLTKYTMTSGNDSEERDPLKWELEGSINGLTFVTIDSKENQDFATPGLKREFVVSGNKTPYLFYRLKMNNNSGTTTQLSEWALFGIESTPSKDVFADFVTKSYLVSGDAIAFENGALNATTFKWTFKGGNPSKSTEMNPKVVYDKPGNYEVKLVVSNGKSKSTKTTTIAIKDLNDWSSFVAPKVILDCKNTANEGFVKYQKYVKKRGFETIEDFVKNCCLTIAKNLYRTVDEANEHKIRNINYILREGGYISYENTMTPDIEIGFDMDYLNKFSQTHSDDASSDEVYGILCHELTHGYQNWPKNAGSYGGKNECTGFIEGVADLSRLLTGGFNPKRYPRTGGSWLDGYNTTGFFYLWLNNTKDPKFLQKLNRTAVTLDTWSLNAAIQQLFGVSAQSLWDEYQLAIPTIVAESKKADAAAAANKN